MNDDYVVFKYENVVLNWYKWLTWYVLISFCTHKPYVCDIDSVIMILIFYVIYFGLFVFPIKDQLLLWWHVYKVPPIIIILLGFWSCTMVHLFSGTFNISSPFFLPKKIMISVFLGLVPRIHCLLGNIKQNPIDCWGCMYNLISHL